MELRKEDFIFEPLTEEYKAIHEQPSISYWQDAFRRLKQNKVAILSLIILILLFLSCIFLPIISPYDYQVGELAEKNQGPSIAHPFGTDALGRDIFTRVWVGGRVSLFIGIMGALIDMTIGVIYGGIAGYFGGKVDQVMMRIIELLSSIPYLVLVVLISLVLGKGILSLIIAMTFTGWCFTARLVRGQVLQIKSQDFILASRAIGTNPFKIIRNHVIPNILSVVIVSVTFDIPSFIFGEAFLSYVGLGIQSPMTSWGALASDAQANMAFYPHQLFFPALMISLTMLAFQLLGDGLRDALDPKLRQ